MQASTTALQQQQHSSGVQPAANEAISDAAAQARSLHIQAAKVVTAHAASVGDNLLGVPLLAAAGLPAEAAALLQVRPAIHGLQESSQSTGAAHTRLLQSFTAPAQGSGFCYPYS